MAPPPKTFSRSLYNAIFRRNSIFVGTLVMTGFVFEQYFNIATDSIFEYWNRG
ncbi:hypothetical protein HMI54_003801, partial [Coelomomyces lativittatus]